MDWEQKTLLNELKEGREVTNQLMKHLHPSSSNQTRQLLLDKILCSYDKALSILSWNGFVVETKPTLTAFESSPAIDHSSEVSDKKHVLKKRKTSSGETQQLRVCSEKSLDNPLDDGYCWRKYGQKAILGSNFPRGYYRCTHRHSQGCLATKQVQRSDNDPTNFEVKYRGRHTCNQASHSAVTFVPISAESKTRKRPYQLEETQKQVQHTFLSFETGLKALIENDIMGSLSLAFVSPATSESNYFSVSPCHMGSFESDLTDIISDPTSVSNSPIGDLDISSLDKLEFDPSFPFDNPEFFS
ncbi:putative NAD(P)-binding Rossmann-fold superfamily protein [Hibiscus syriacus]|uniref:NAD(P)-binding Rossmann-fold superfamily protein n=1 Tax=Hibiscus syriacus TaxID=106335 RepID=A0A6A3CH21_HIBSY|nr:putative NAD(P)-binding Rossmann-fold superfamily protein [Hibiscus syriacus]